MFAHARSLSFAAVLTAASLFGLAGEAAAMQCANHDNMARALTGKFKETRRAMGLVNSTGGHGSLHVTARHVDRARDRHQGNSLYRRQW